MLTNKTISQLDEHSIRVHDRNQVKDKFYREIEFHSPLGEDVVMTIWYDGTGENFIESFTEYAKDFDVDDHVKDLVPMMGKQGVPNSIEALVNDAKDIKTILLKTSEHLSLEFNISA